MLRGFGIVPSAFMVVRLAMYTGSTGAVFDPRPAPDGELWTYVAIVVAAFLGSSLGDRLRARFNSEGIIIMILALVYLGSGLMLRLFHDPGVTAFYALLTAGAGGAFALLWWRPGLLARCEEALARCRGRCRG